MTSTKNPASFINDDLMILNWYFLMPKTIEKEIETSLWRNMVEE